MRTAKIFGPSPEKKRYLPFSIVFQAFRPREDRRPSTTERWHRGRIGARDRTDQ
jgi:hypothetical protein